jgi:hypothetical protein
MSMSLLHFLVVLFFELVMLFQHFPCVVCLSWVKLSELMTLFEHLMSHLCPLLISILKHLSSMRCFFFNFLQSLFGSLFVHLF